METQKNRDILIKICFIYFLNHILKVLDINEEIEDSLPTESITWTQKEKFKIFNQIHDFRATTKSGKIIIFEFKKNILRKKDLKQVYEYYKHTYCKEKTDIMAIIIVISDKGKIREYREMDITYHPKIIKTKKINKQEDLKIIRNKFKNNIKLSTLECSLLITLPLFDIKEKEDEIVEEMVKSLKLKKHCISKNEWDGIIMGMYLNIIEYIKPEKQNKLMEMVNMAAKTEGVIAKWKREQRTEAKNEGMKKGITLGEKNIILELLKENNINDVSRMIHKEESEIKKIIK